MCLSVNLELWKRHRGSQLPQGSWWSLLNCLSQCLHPVRCLCKPLQCAQKTRDDYRLKQSVSLQANPKRSWCERESNLSKIPGWRRAWAFPPVTCSDHLEKVMWGPSASVRRQYHRTHPHLRDSTEHRWMRPSCRDHPLKLKKKKKFIIQRFNYLYLWFVFIWQDNYLLLKCPWSASLSGHCKSLFYNPAWRTLSTRFLHLRQYRFADSYLEKKKRQTKKLRSD